MSLPRPMIQSDSTFVFFSQQSRVQPLLKIFTQSMVSSGQHSKMHASHWAFFLMITNGTSVWRRQVIRQQDISSEFSLSLSFTIAFHQIQDIFGTPTSTDYVMISDTGSSIGTFERIHPMKMFGTMAFF